MTAKMKYACNIAGTLVKVGTVVEILNPEDERVQRIWPGIQHRMDSMAICVQFPHLSFPTLIHSEQLNFE